MRRWRRTEAAGAALALAACATPARVPADERAERAPVTGQLLSRYRARFTGEESDHDLHQTLDLALADPGGRWTGALLARASYDLDGGDGGGQSDFFELSDTHDHRLVGQLFHAYADLAVQGWSVLRAGRQTLYETPLTVVIDGLRAELAPRGARRWSVGAFAGLGEHPYESSSGGDAVLGTHGALRPWPGAELRADWMHLEDERLGVQHEDDLLGLVLGQELEHGAGEDRTRLETRFTSLGGDGRDLRLSGNHWNGSHGLSFQASYYRLLRTQGQLAAPLDPFSSTLFELFPYSQLGLSATKDWEVLALLAGADLRRVEDSGDVGEFNRDFERYYLTGTLPDLLTLDVSLTGELWHATDTDHETWGASLARTFAETWEASLGSYFALYEYDLTSGEERERVRVTALDLRWKLDAQRRWTLRYEFEHNDFDEYQEVRLDYAWGF